MEREDKNKIDEIRNTINPRRYISSRLLKNEKLDEMISMAKTYRDAFAGQVNVRFDDKSFERMLEADDGTITEIQKVIEKEMPDADKEILLVIDATTGQNAISQVKAFKEVAPITGLVLTKLDGTAKGGVVIGIVNENKMPVKFIGVGEQIDDMEIFNSKDFVDAII